MYFPLHSSDDTKECKEKSPSGYAMTGVVFYRHENVFSLYNTEEQTERSNRLFKTYTQHLTRKT
jgi:hypothetical protein